MAANNIFMKPVLMLGLASIISIHGSTNCFATNAQSKDYLSQVVKCKEEMRANLHASLNEAPQFNTLHEATKWLSDNIPLNIRRNFSSAGRAVSRSLTNWERHGMIQNAFWNIQALSELLVSQSNGFSNIAGCNLNGNKGVVSEIIRDQIFISINGKFDMNRLSELGISDQFYFKKIIIYGLILDFANISWTDEELARLALFKLDLPL